MQALSQNLPFTHALKGKRQQWQCWEIRPSALAGYSCAGVLCLVCYVTLPKKYHFTNLIFIDSIHKIYHYAHSELVYSFCLIPVDDSHCAEKLMKQFTLDIAAGSLECLAL